mmetsp:Transcript_14747/g.29573  ORF Transcript_14747/g.29573 Transcript_14747/m.29573 type:complete len:94 (-) Transcript_14747:2038-2319(-)
MVSLLFVVTIPESTVLESTSPVRSEILHRYVAGAVAVEQGEVTWPSSTMESEAVTESLSTRTCTVGDDELEYKKEIRSLFSCPNQFRRVNLNL